MATSSQVLGSQSQRFNDLDLLVVLHLLIRQADVRSGADTELARLASHWRHVCETYGPGLIDLELETTIKDPSSKSLMLALLSGVDSQLDAVGETYPAQRLMEGWLTPGVIPNSAYQTKLLRSATASLRKLVDS